MTDQSRATQTGLFPISRDPPEGGTEELVITDGTVPEKFPISRDPPEGGTPSSPETVATEYWCFQFLGIPPKGEQHNEWCNPGMLVAVSFQFLGIPPKGELYPY